MRYAIIVLSMLFGMVTSAIAQVSISIGLPHVSIGINLPLYPELVRVPGYPVYYAPRLNSNYFFYDGMYWVYEGDNWYASSWYNGPWGLVYPEVVPLFVLRIPVQYYRHQPAYFRGWRADAPPRWGDHWGHEWERNRSGWDSWNHSSAPAPAPLPVYQGQYSGDRYPRVEQQMSLHGQNYQYQPREPVVRQHYQEPAMQRAPAPSQGGQQRAPQRINPQSSVQQDGPTAPRSMQPQRGGEDVPKSAPAQSIAPQPRGPAVQDQKKQTQQAPTQREQKTQTSGQKDVPKSLGTSQEQKRGQGQEKDRDTGEERSQERR